MKLVEDFYEEVEESESKFFKGYIIFVLLLLLIFAGVLSYLWFALSKYEAGINGKSDSSKELAADIEAASGPSDELIEQAEQLCFENFMSSVKGSDLVAFWNNTYPEHLDSDESIATFIDNNILNAQYQLYKSSEFTLEAPRYVVMSEGSKLMEVFLEGAGEAWSVGDVSFLTGGYCSADAIIPTDCTLCINSRDVSTEHIVGESQYVSLDGYEDALVNPEGMSEYLVNGLVAEPQISVKAAELGNNVVLSADGKYYKTVTEGAEDIKNKADSFIESLLSYYSNGKENAEANMQKVLSHVASGSQAAKIINESISGVVWTTAYSSNYVREKSDVYYLAQNCYCVDVAYRDESEDAAANSGEGIYRVYFLDEGNGYKIVQFAGLE